MKQSNKRSIFLSLFLILTVIVAVFMQTQAQAATIVYPYVVPEYELEGTTIEKGTTAEIKFTVYQGTVARYRYYCNLYEGDNNKGKKVASAGDNGQVFTSNP